MTGTMPSERDFDWWRSQYDTMTDNARRSWDSRCYRYWPDQAHGNVAQIEESVAGAATVVEIGGWRGDHAGLVLAKSEGVVRWTNIEFCRDAVGQTKCEDSRYTVVLPNEFRWWRKFVVPSADVIVMSHVAEHLSAPDLAELMKAVAESKVKRVYMEAPLSEDGSAWMGYLGTHILPWGWPRLDAEMAERGYRVEKQFPITARLYARG